MADYDKPAFIWKNAAVDFDGQAWPIPPVSPQPSQFPTLANAFGEAGSGVTPSEWGMPIVG
jgi:hypothetical protein